MKVNDIFILFCSMSIICDNLDDWTYLDKDGEFISAQSVNVTSDSQGVGIHKAFYKPGATALIQEQSFWEQILPDAVKPSIKSIRETDGARAIVGIGGSIGQVALGAGYIVGGAGESVLGLGQMTFGSLQCVAGSAQVALGYAEGMSSTASEIANSHVETGKQQVNAGTEYACSGLGYIYQGVQHLYSGAKKSWSGMMGLGRHSWSLGTAVHSSLPSRVECESTVKEVSTGFQNLGTSIRSWFNSTVERVKGSIKYATTLLDYDEEVIGSPLGLPPLPPPVDHHVSEAELRASIEG